MNFIEICELLEKIESTASRNDVTTLVADFLNKADNLDTQIFVYLLMGRVAPQFVPAEFNLSEKGLLKVLNSIAPVEVDVNELRKQMGDIGRVAESVCINSVGELSLIEVYELLWSIVNTSGSGSVMEKQSIVSRAVNQMTGLEARYFTRIIIGKLRLGVSSKTILDSLSVFYTGDKSSRSDLDNAFGVDPDIGALVYRVKTEGVEKLTIDPEAGVPLLSRLVERVKSFDEVFERLGEEVILQPKFDGLRCQVHKGVNYSVLDTKERVWAKYYSADSEVGLGMFETPSEDRSIRLFSRNLEDMTDMFPEVVEAVTALDADSLIIDCEVLGWNFDADSFVPFQDTMTRKRKHGIEDARDKLPVKLFVFDIMMLNGENLVSVDTEKRLEILKGLLENSDSKVIELTEVRVVNDISQIDEFFETSVAKGLEGLIVKKLSGGYEAGKRNYDWIKLKKSMKKSLVDAVDIVVMGYYRGSGKRSGFGVGALLGGIYNPETECIESVTKIGTGITDEELATISERFASLEVADMPKGYLVGDGLIPDVWVLPEVVCSVEADEVTLSKVHMAARAPGGEVGLALRFPRLIEFDRDKNVDQTTSPEELRSMAAVELK